MPKNLAFFFLFSFFSYAGAWAQSSIPEDKDLLQRGIALCEQGAYQEAISVLRSAYIYFEKEQDKPQQARTQEYLAKSYLYTGQIDKATETYLRAYDISKKYGPPKTFLSVAEALSEIYKMNTRHLEANEIIREAIKVAKEEEEHQLHSIFLSNLGIGYLRIGILDTAQMLIEKALALKKERNDSTNLTMHYNHLGTLYKETGDLDKSIDYQIKAIKKMETKGQKPQLVIQYTNISAVFSQQLNLDKAEEYATRAIALARQENLGQSLAVSLQSLGTIRFKQNRMEEALEYYKESLDIYRSAKAKTAPLKSDLLQRIGKIYMRLGNLKAAEAHLTEGVELAELENNTAILIDLNLTFTNLHLRQNNLPVAKQYLSKAFKNLQKYQQPGKMSAYYRTEKKYFQALGAPQKALASFRLSEQFKTEEYNQEKNEKVLELEARYERAKKEQKITQLNAENKIKDLRIQKTRRNNFIASLALLLALGLALLLYYLNRTRRLAIERLGEKNITISSSLKEKEILLREIHHRVKNNLQVVSSLLRLQTKYIKDEKALDAIHEGRNRVKSMSLIHQNLYQLDNLTGVQADDYIQKLSKSLFHSYNISPERVRLETEIDELNIDVDTIIPIGLILNELLTNALKHAFPDQTEGLITVKLKREKEQLVLEVQDNGIGMLLEKDGSVEKEGFGINLIHSFLEKLKAELAIYQENGTVVRLFIRKFKLV